MSRLAYLLLAAVAFASAQPVLEHLRIQSVEVAEVSTDRVRLKVNLGGVAPRDIALRTLTFDDASVNGVPLFASPVSGPVRIPKGSRFSDAGALEATVFYRDLPSLEPVRQMLREEKASVRATVRLQPELSLLQRMALRTWGAWVSWKVEQTVQVQLPGGRAAKTAAELALAGADSVWVAGRRGLEWRRERDTFRRHVWQTYSGRVLPVRTQYTVRAKDGLKSVLEWRGLAFHAGGGEVLVPAEAVEPWMFDGAVADAVASGALEVIPESVDIKAGRYSLNAGTLSIVDVLRDQGKGLSVERRKTYALRDRASSANLARLHIPSLVAPRVNASNEAGAAVAVFRTRQDGTTELLMNSVAMEKGQPRLADPVDGRVFGSPVAGRNGFYGIVVSQTAIAR